MSELALIQKAIEESQQKMSQLMEQNYDTEN